MVHSQYNNKLPVRQYLPSGEILYILAAGKHIADGLIPLAHPYTVPNLIVTALHLYPIQSQHLG